MKDLMSFLSVFCLTCCLLSCEKQNASKEVAPATVNENIETSNYGSFNSQIEWGEHLVYIADRTVWDELGESFVARENGTIYNHHDNINTVRRMMAALENHDMEKFHSFFDENASFRNIHMAVGEKSKSLEDDKKGMKEMMDNYDITGIDVQGYPDYLNYGLGNAKVVQSWWKLRMTRKSDDKKIVMPLFLIHDFDDEGKISYTSKTSQQNKLLNFKVVPFYCPIGGTAAGTTLFTGFIDFR